MKEVQPVEGWAECTIKVQRARSRAGGPFCFPFLNTEPARKTERGGTSRSWCLNVNLLDIKAGLVFVVGTALSTVRL